MSEMYGWMDMDDYELRYVFNLPLPAAFLDAMQYFEKNYQVQL